MGTSLTIASQTIGFISFAFTLATATGVFWENFQTFVNAPKEIHDTLSNLKQTLYEERFYIRRMRRRRNSRRRRSGNANAPLGPTDSYPMRIRGVGTDQSLQAMQTAVKHMISQFQVLEEPYLTDEARYQRGRKRKSGLELDDDVWGPEDVDVGFEAGEGGGDFYDMVYKPPGFSERLRWTRSKNTAVTLFNRVQRMQLRRVAMQSAEIGLVIRGIDKQMLGVDDSLDHIEDRLSRAFPGERPPTYIRA